MEYFPLWEPGLLGKFLSQASSDTCHPSASAAAFEKEMGTPSEDRVPHDTFIQNFP
jgi:hypothetical protein